MKKLVTLGIVSILTLSLTGCDWFQSSAPTNEQPNATEETTSTTEPVTKSQTPLEKLNNLASTLKVEDPETYNYPGCGIIHGQDGKIDNWTNNETAYNEKLFSLLNEADSKFELIKLDYSQNPNGASDDVQIVTCSCDEYTEAKQLVDNSGLDFADLLWHTEDRENDRMTPCLKDVPFR